ncbi:MAG: class I SAM-dependent methyltransferase [Thermoanaerobaculia bacterium]
MPGIGEGQSPVGSFWDRAYRDGDHLEHWEPERPPEELGALVAAGLVREGDAALDVGCGAGTEALRLASLGLRVIGVDRSAAALEIARERSAEAGLAVDWRQGDALELPVADDSVRLVVDRGCLHVIDRELRERYAAEVSRVLEPGGTLLLRGARSDSDEEGVVGFDDRELDELFGPLGFARGPLVPSHLVARSGTLPSWLVVLTASSP